MTANQDRPAFPTNARMHSEAQGITKREYFAAMAMQGILASRSLQKALYRDVSAGLYEDRTHQNALAAEAVMQADELLKQLGE